MFKKKYKFVKVYHEEQGGDRWRVIVTYSFLGIPLYIRQQSAGQPQ